MRESGENPEQYPLPYVREAAAHGASRSLGAILRRRSVSHGAPGAPHRTSRKTYDVKRWACVSVPKMLRGKVGRGRETISAAAYFCRGKHRRRAAAHEEGEEHNNETTNTKVPECAFGAGPDAGPAARNSLGGGRPTARIYRRLERNRPNRICNQF